MPVIFAGTAHERALDSARRWNCRVAIVHNGNDGPGRVWETFCEAADGSGFHPGAGFRVSQIVHPDGRITPPEAA